MNVREEKSRNKILLGQDGNALINLIILNAIIFVLLYFIYVVYRISNLNLEAYYKNIFDWFILPADLTKLSSRPWTILTYMFTHEKLIHLLGNMFFLWSFGYILQDLAGNRKLVPIYIYGGVAGAVFFTLSYYLLPSLHDNISTETLMGANVSIMAVAVATTALSPDYRIFPMINGGIPLWILTLAYAIIDIASIKVSRPAEYIAHFSGAAMGLFFVYQLRKGKDWSEWMNKFFDWVDNLFNPRAKNVNKPAKEEFFYKVKESQPYKKTPNVTQKRVDEILDKINQKGFHFLTDEEKDILKRAASGDDF